jgi:hypothetical protein
VVGRSAGGAPILVEGVRGVVERNTLRYYLALQSHLQSGGAPDGGPLQKNMDLWFTATERYADQLREMDRADYVAMKLKEVQRQATVAPPPPG